MDLPLGQSLDLTNGFESSPFDLKGTILMVFAKIYSVAFVLTEFIRNSKKEGKAPTFEFIRILKTDYLILSNCLVGHQFLKDSSVSPALCIHFLALSIETKKIFFHLHLVGNFPLKHRFVEKCQFTDVKMCQRTILALTNLR